MPSSRSLIVLLATVLGVGVTASLGRWQLNRAAEKTALHDMMQTRALQPPLRGEELPCNEAELQAQLQRTVTVRGRWLPRHTLWLDNRPMAGRAGLLVLTPLQLEPAVARPSGDNRACAAVILVQRGWVPRNFLDRTQVAVVPTPEGVVTVAGRLALPPSSLMALGRGASQAEDQEPRGEGVGGAIRQNVDLTGLSGEWGVALRPGSIQQTADEQPPPPGGTGLLREWWQPAADVGRHNAYAAQWFALAALMAGMYLWFQWFRPRRG